MQNKGKIYSECLMPAVVNECETENLRRSLRNKLKQAKKINEKNNARINFKDIEISQHGSVNRTK